MKIKIEDFNQYELYIKKALKNKSKKTQKAVTKLIMQAFTDGVAYANMSLEVEVEG